ncbi:MAG TPA: hypothetical protein VFW87_06770 [Pirellulales bacterium]|nr:hypothetical protein [Pirellulales bacterium]
MSFMLVYRALGQPYTAAEDMPSLAFDAAMGYRRKRPGKPSPMILSTEP